MDVTRLLGTVAHRGGLLVEQATVRVGVARMVSTTSGLRIDVVARRPPDGRSTAERQAAIRAGEEVAAAPRRLLPPVDEGTELRLGWLDSDGAARWAYPQSASGDSGGSAPGAPGPTLRAAFLLPPLYGATTLLLAWPEIGFPEATVELMLPDARSVENASVSIWDADLPDAHTPSWTRRLVADTDTLLPVVEETRTAIAAPQTLLRSEDAVLVLRWLSADDTVLQATVTGVVRGSTADRLQRARLSAHRRGDEKFRPFFDQDPPMFGIVQVDTVTTAEPIAGTATAAMGFHETELTFLLPRPAGHQFRLAVGWPQVGLPAAEVLLAPWSS